MLGSILPMILSEPLPISLEKSENTYIFVTAPPVVLLEWSWSSAREGGAGWHMEPFLRLVPGSADLGTF